MKLGALLTGDSGVEVKVTDTAENTVVVRAPLVQHLMLDPANPGLDLPGFKVSFH